MIDTRKELEKKLDKLSIEQLNSVCQFVEFLEYKQKPANPKNSLTNKDIERVFDSYRQQNSQQNSQQNKQRFVSLAKSNFNVREDLSEPLPDEFLDLFES